jgi:rod shape-determining protein MreC
MEFLLSRYRNLTILLIVIVAQLVLIAYQVKTNKNVPLIRIWAVSAVTPVEQALEFVRRNTIGRVEDYFVLLGVRSENERMRKEIGELKLQNNYLQNELTMADRVRALTSFQRHAPSKTLAAEIIGNGTGANSKVVFIDRGSASGVEAGMAVITPDGIVGKVLDAYPTASLVMLITDPTFAAGVVSQKNHVRGTLKGQGNSACIVDYVQNEQKVESGEWFYTSGEDRIFPKGLPVGKVDAVRNGKTFKEIYVSPSAFQNGVEEVLVVLEGVHQAIPDTLVASPGYKLLAPPPDVAGQKAQAGDSSTSVLSTDADRLKQEYKATGEAQNHVYGEGAPGSKPPDFTKLGTAPAVPPKPASAAPAGTAANPPKPSGAPASAGASATSPGAPKSTASTAPAAGVVPGAASPSKPGATTKPVPAGTQPAKPASQTETTQPRSASGPDESAPPETPAKPKPRVVPPAVPGATGATESGTPDPSVLKPRPPAPNPAPPPPPAP